MKASTACALLVLASTTAWSGFAHAEDDKAACLDSYVKAQKLRQDAKLRTAMSELAKCSREACPAMIRAECTKWQTETEQSIPSVVFSVHGPDGSDLTDVKVTMDDEVLASDLKGTAINVDPGPHRFLFERPGNAPKELKLVVLLEGEKRRKIDVVLAAADRAPAATPVTLPPPPPAKGEKGEDAPSGPSRPIPTSVFVLGGIGIAAFGGFVGFALSGYSGKSDLDDCKPFCSKDQIDDNKTTFLISDIFLGVSVVSLGVATYLFLTRPEARSTNAASRGYP